MPTSTAVEPQSQKNHFIAAFTTNPSPKKHCWQDARAMLAEDPGKLAAKPGRCAVLKKDEIPLRAEISVMQTETLFAVGTAPGPEKVWRFSEGAAPQAGYPPRIPWQRLPLLPEFGSEPVGE